MATLPRVSEPGLTPNVDLVGSAGIGARAQAQLFSQLADTASELRRQMQPYLDEQFANQAGDELRAAWEGRDDPAVMPSLPRRSAGTQQGRVFNNAIQTGALARARVDGSRIFSEIAAEYPADPEGFEQAGQAALERYLENANGEVGAGIELALTAEFQSNLEAIQQRRASLDIQEADQSIGLEMERLIAERDTSLRTDMRFAETGGYQDNRMEFEALVRSRVDNDSLAYSESYYETAMESYDTGSMREVLRGEVDRQYEQHGLLSALVYLEDNIDSIPVSAEERASYRNSIAADLSNESQIENVRRADATRARTEAINAAKDEADTMVFDILTRGTAPTDDEVARARDYVGLGALDSSRWQSMMSALSSNGASVDDIGTVRTLRTLSRDPDMTRSTYEDAVYEAWGSGQIRRETAVASLDRFDAVLNQRVGSGVDIIDAAFNIVGGTSIFGGDSSQAEVHQDLVTELQNWAQDNDAEITRNDIEERARSLLRARFDRTEWIIPSLRSIYTSNETGGPTSSATSITPQTITDQWIDEQIAAYMDNYGEDNPNVESFARQLEELRASAQVRMQLDAMLRQVNNGGGQ